MALITSDTPPHAPSSLLQLHTAIINHVNKTLLYGSVAVFGTIGGYVPSLWHAGPFSASGILGGIVGTIFGIWAAFKINDYINV